MLLFRGDIARFRLFVDHRSAGTGWLRTNIGAAAVIRREIIAEVDENESPMHHDWFDIPMAEADDGGFEIALPLCEVGHFEAKAYFLPDGGQPLWPPGDNTHINVEPAGSVCANSVYNAFIRQFGPNKHERQKPPADIDLEKFDAAGYTVIPPSGTFRSFKKELDFIIDELGCRYIQLLPINPTPTTYGRMGRFGSPYASQSFRLVDTALAEFDRKATPMDQFIELVDAIHSRHAKVILDIAINHTGWGARLHEMHPDWLKRDDAGKIEIPGAWGILWEDLTKLDFSQKALWRFMARVFLTWCRRGVDGFRCDAGYMIPRPAWRYIIARVREQYPDTIFFLEGLGGKISVTRDLLNRGNLNWAYSELFQNYDRGQIHHYLPEANDIASSDGVMINFAETHDNPRLASVSATYARMRTALCAMLSNHGGFAFANGVEWFATEKIDVHDATPLNWGAKLNQVNHIRRLNTILKTQPAFFDGVEISFVESGEGNFLAVFRRHADVENSLLILVNLDCEHPVTACWRIHFPGDSYDGLFDLISLRRFDIESNLCGKTLPLEAGQVVCLCLRQQEMKVIESAEKKRPREPERIIYQRLRSKVLDVYRHFHGISHMGAFDRDREADLLRADPVGYCRSHNTNHGAPCVICWRYPDDLNREVMVPPGQFLMVSAPVYFEARIVENERVLVIEKALEMDNKGYFVLFSPLDGNPRHTRRDLKLTLYNESPDQKGGDEHIKGALLYLRKPGSARINTLLDRDSVMSGPKMLIAANGSGGLCRVSSWWGRLASKYDAILGANMNPELPDNRRIMFTRCRGWIVHQDYSQSIRTECILDVALESGRLMKWRYKIPTGLGLHVRITVVVEMVRRENRVIIQFYRHAKTSGDQLSDDRPVRLILRPDIEDRSFHETTKAFTGPEHAFPEAVFSDKEGFLFSPHPERHLNVYMPGAGFVWEPEWSYMVYRPIEEERGMDPHSDLYSPGYFEGELKGGQSLALEAEVTPDKGKKPVVGAVYDSDAPGHSDSESIPFPEALLRAMDHFVVERQKRKSVIAGYPWFLDWGRDSLIFCRGLIAAGKVEAALQIIKLFGQFEEKGTLPNMISGEDARNRDTSDAPLWFMVACRDLAEKTGSGDFLDEPCGDRTLREISFSIVSAYATGTANGVKMDPDTGLIFSPSHFTWMDTNFPAGTPRQGYPVEIQALWYAALEFLSGIAAPSGVDAKDGLDLEDTANRVASAFIKYFYQPDKGFLSDCLHCAPGCSPPESAPDDFLRPNQLLALTMGLVKDKTLGENILTACSELLVPGAIRSLSDRPVDYPLEIYHNGKILGDPYRPYRGRYLGDEDYSRKPAYHNGTAWTWLFPSFCEAWWMLHGDRERQTALAWLSSSILLANEGCLGHIPEITDGDYPHIQRGCDAQAWGASELYRIWSMLEE